MGVAVFAWLLGKDVEMDKFYKLAVLLGLTMISYQLQKINESFAEMMIVQLQMYSCLDRLKYSSTAAGGNMVKILLGIGEKLSFMEVRLMRFIWDDHEISRHISQVLDDWGASVKTYVKEISQLWESWKATRIRMKDLPANREMSLVFGEIFEKALAYEIDGATKYAEAHPGGSEIDQAARGEANNQLQKLAEVRQKLERSWT